jgi:hypothetical protein
MTSTNVKAHDWSLTPLIPAPRSELRDRAELRKVDDKMMAVMAQQFDEVIMRCFEAKRQHPTDVRFTRHRLVDRFGCSTTD